MLNSVSEIRDHVASRWRHGDAVWPLSPDDTLFLLFVVLFYVAFLAGWFSALWNGN
jgi:hypothetical protein